jgi:hypothetical protein
VLVEVPFYPPEAVFMNAEYVFNSTAHWRPLMNGYSGYTPASYREYSWIFWNLAMSRALANPALERIAVGRGNITLFRVK